jgi:F-type H+-transporting ATPase subunit epsilon
MHLVIAKVDETLFEGEARSVTVPGAEGELTVMGEHMPLISTLKEGDITVRLGDNSAPRVFHVLGGVLEVRRDGATVIL